MQDGHNIHLYSHLLSVSRAVNVRVVAVSGLVFDVGSGDGDTASLLFGSLVNGRVVNELASTGISEDLGDRSSQRGLAVILK